MEHPPLTSIEVYFGSLPDPRVERTRAHRLTDLLTIAWCAILCGANDWVAVETFGHAKETWLRTFLPLPGGIPAHDTFGRVFARLDPTALQQCFVAWVQAVVGDLPAQVVALDGKTSRGSADRSRGQAALHLVSAWASPNGRLAFWRSGIGLLGNGERQKRGAGQSILQPQAGGSASVLIHERRLMDVR